MASGSFRQRGCKCPPTRKRCTCGAKWYYRYDIIDPGTGKRKQKETKGFRTKAEAEAEAKRIQYKLQQGTYIEVKDITFAKYADQWLEMYRNSGVKNSTAHLRSLQLKHLLDHFGHIPLKDVTKFAYQDMLNKLSVKFSRKTVSGVHEVGSMIFEKALEMDVIGGDPTQFASVPKKKPTLEESESDEIPRYLEKDELIKFLQAVELHGKPHDYPLFMLIAYTGLRIGEAIALKWTDISEVNSTVSITKTLYRASNRLDTYWLQPPKTKSSKRTIDVDYEVIKVLKQYKKWQNQCKLAATTYHESDFIFTTNEGYPLSAKYAWQKMKNILTKIGLPPLTTHSLRHTHASLLAEAGAKLEVIQKRLGHNSSRVTEEIYLHVTKPRMKEASQKFSELLGNVK